MDSNHTNQSKPTPKLYCDARKQHALQISFEDAMIDVLCLNRGTLAISADGTRYLNEHVQWLWERYYND